MVNFTQFAQILLFSKMHEYLEAKFQYCQIYVWLY